MTNEEIIDILKAHPNYLMEKSFKLRFPFVYEYILKTEFPENFSLKQKTYHYLHDDLELKLGICPVCGKRCSFQNFVYGYSTYCSLQCSGKSEDVQAHRKTTVKQIYGVDYVLQDTEVRALGKKTMLDLHGVEYAMQSEEIRKKAETTCEEKHGMPHPLQCTQFKEKAKSTNLKNRGVEWPAQSKEVLEKMRLSNLENLGVEWPMQAEQTKEKSRTTCFRKYGFSSHNSNEEIKEKKKQVFLDSYGVENPFQAEEIKQKIKKTNNERYDVDNPFQSPTICDKIRKTKQERYGSLISSSNLENELFEYISSIYQGTILQNDRHAIGKEIDVYLPELKLGFEFNGDYWHMNPAIYSADDMNESTNMHAYEHWKIDEDKRNLAKENGIEIITVWENDWKNDRENIEKNIIKYIKQKINLLLIINTLYFLYSNCIMQTIKLKYHTSEENLKVISDFQKQYSSCLHYLYNRLLDNPSITEKELRSCQKDLNNIDLIKSYLFQCAVKEAKQIIESGDKPIIFGGKSLFFRRMKNLISKDEFKTKRLNPIYIIGEKPKHSNRLVQINNDLNSITFKPSKDNHIELQLVGVKNRQDILEKLFYCQLNNSIPITYKISQEYVHISFDETILASNDYVPVKNRVFAIDLNPNYIGWSIADWKSSSDFDIVKSGVYSIKDLNDYDFSLKHLGYSSDSKQRRYISNKRRHETLQISKNLINIARHYRCELFGIEDLNIESSNKEKGSRFNKLCNNIWNRNTLVNNLSKRCNIFGIKMLRVKANYSSFIGNLLFRDLNMPDMVLASIEIGRRAFEFNNQYIKKEKEIQHNIMQPNISDFKDLISKSLEEFGVNEKFESLIDLYYIFKNSKLKYRVPLDESLKFYRFGSSRSRIKRTFCYNLI